MIEATNGDIARFATNGDIARFGRNLENLGGIMPATTGPDAYDRATGSAALAEVTED